MPRPEKTEYAAFYQPYIDKIEGEDLSLIIGSYSEASLEFWQSIPEEMADFAYAPGKWTVMQVLNHINDAERIFAYRALRIARGDETPLAGFDENDYADAAQLHHRTLHDLIQEFQAIRASSLFLFGSFGERELLRIGTANGVPVSVNAIGFVILGHMLHHEEVMRERYGV
ncbi:DinB family protein [soil metagenome]